LSIPNLLERADFENARFSLFDDLPVHWQLIPFLSPP
jgi:hypothetical protein